MKNSLLVLLAICVSLSGNAFATVTLETPVSSHITVVGGGIISALESYYAYKEALKNGQKICINVYEKGNSFEASNLDQASTNTSYNIVPSLTIDEILCIVPRGSELIEKLEIPFSQPGGIRVEDVVGANDSEKAIRFKEAVVTYGYDKDHEDRTLSLLMLGKKSMDLWQEMYDEGDAELKEILEASNYNPCREPKGGSSKGLHEGYRIDLIYDIPNVKERALRMQADYEKLGYKACAILSPDEVVAIDPYLADFCRDHSTLDVHGNRIWQQDAVALWRPGGCIDTRVFLPKLYLYLQKKLGQYKDADHQIHDCFQLHFDKEVVALEFDSTAEDLQITGLKFADGTCQMDNHSQYLFCPGESVGTLENLGFHEPTYAGFAGASLLITIPLSNEQMERYKTFSHCMEVHNEGITLAWQARYKENTIFIGVAGTKACYGDKQPNKNEAFAKNRNLVQLNMVNDVLPEFISIASGYNTRGKKLSAEELFFLEERGIAERWVGRRAVAYDGFPTMGSLYSHNRKVKNARCTTHLGSGGVAFGPGAVFMSRASEQNSDDPFTQKILRYSDSRRTAE